MLFRWWVELMNKLAAFILAVAVFGTLVAAPIAVKAGTPVATQSDDSTAPEVEFIPEEDTAFQNESTSISLQVHNQVNAKKPVLVRVFEPHGSIAEMRVNGEPPGIPQNNTRMWQTYEDLEPRQRLVVPITFEPNSRPGEYTVYAQVKYFNESGEYTEEWESMVLEIRECSLSCRLEQVVENIVDVFVAYRNTIIALLSLIVAILSLLAAVQRG